ncbi:hypothetical protein [Acinetobacter haemolyticus]|uniref:DUF3396 domain-containing protein n=1 Tax=Acinetobacter haemolyticus TaxID=29430 RepID=A0AAJ3D9I1_ACIHA|nr:hypothetical protein [Acinetobacter haemolyticus]APR70542.1 hypothetical protein AHTJS_09225 [Acinetobacter haemolyticus]NAR31153.1 hypothetical protein [Acinetobacter haemolyticus]NAR65299.1 hypothetical protein [Acinetobacter haemolyticus]NAR74892.1 hypothetical protein [Acinetobacter haemolyticus]
MSQFGIRPQEIYLIERYSSVEYFKELVDAFENMLNAAEYALQVFMQDLPYDYRNWHISQQPDVVWGEHVLPNFRSTLASLNYGYKRLLDGDLTALQYAGNVVTDFRGQTADYLPDWMDEDNYRKFNDWQNKASTFSSNIKATVFGNWPMTFLTEGYDVDYFGELNLPSSLPIYHLNSNIIVKTGATVPRDGIYVPEIQDASAQLLLKGRDAIEALVGLDEYCPQYDHKEDTTWILVERIADEGGSSETIQAENLKGFAGQTCQLTGNWWSPANQLQSRYFEQGEVFPEVENNSWGETIWYLEVTNKK